MIFKKGGRNTDQPKFTYAEVEIETVHCLNYLGVVFTKGGSFMNANKTRAGKALKAMYAMLSITRGKEIPIKVILSLFDSFVA